MKAYNLILSAAAVAVIMSGCGGGSSSSNTPIVEENSPVAELAQLQSGRFIDSAVQGLQYTCNPSARIGITDASGIFTCNSGDVISFYIAQNLIGHAMLNGIITPNTFFPNNTRAALNLAQLLQTLDVDGNPDNGIVIDNEKAARLLNRGLDFQDASFDDDVESYLSEVLVNEEAARQHFEASLLALNGGVADGGFEVEEDHIPEEPEADDHEPEEPELDEDIIPDAGDGIDSPAPDEPELEEGDDLPDDLGIELPEGDDEGMMEPELDEDIIPDEDDEIDSPAPGDVSDGRFDTPSIADLLGNIGSIGEVMVPRFLQADQFKTTLVKVKSDASDDTMESTCKEEYGDDASLATWTQIENLSALGVDMEDLILSLSMDIDNSRSLIDNDSEIAFATNTYALKYTDDYVGNLDIDNGIELITINNFSFDLDDLEIETKPAIGGFTPEVLTPIAGGISIPLVRRRTFSYPVTCYVP